MAELTVTRVFDLLERYEQKYGNNPNAYNGKENGQWRSWSFNEFKSKAYQIAAGLIDLGVKPGDRIGLVANNRPEWNIIDFGSQLCGAVLVPIYPTISSEDLKFILEDASVKATFVSTSELYDRASAATAGISGNVGVFCFAALPTQKSWEEVLKRGEQHPYTTEIKHILSQVKPDDLCSLLYTSGTTGHPKGVMLTHHNFVSDFTSLCELPPIKAPDTVLSFLPLNHSYERILSYLYLLHGASVWYAESLETVGDNIREVKPYMFTCVPRLVEKVYDRIINKGAELKGIKRALFFWAVEIGEQYEVDPAKRSWAYNQKLKLANKLIFSKWREALGGNVRCMVSGGAALDARLARIFYAAGMPILEGYGLTETSPVISVNNLSPNSLRFGTVGPVIRGVEVKIAEDGEILVKGPIVMKGYYNRPEATAEVIDAEGWFHTGDIGTFVENRFLKITDRKKEIFKTSGGKYIAPQLLENKLKTSRFIEQAMVVGENQKYAVALVVPSFAFIQEWAKRKGLTVGDPQAIVNDPAVKKRIMESVSKINETLAQYETIKKIVLLPREWTTATGELTPKLSMRRKIILNANAEAVDQLYREDK